MPIVRIDIGTGETSVEGGSPKAPGPEMGPRPARHEIDHAVPGLQEWREETLRQPARRPPARPNTLWNQAAEDVRGAVENTLRQPRNIRYN